MRNLLPTPIYFRLSVHILVIVFIQKVYGEGIFGNGDPVIPNHLEVLETFKATALDVVYLDYQKKDSFLLNWLRAADFNVEKANTRLVRSMDWRKQNKIESLAENPEIQKFKKIYKYTVDGVDRQGRRILEFNPGRWDARKVALSGKGKLMQLYWSYMFETGMDMTWGEGAVRENVTEFVLLMDAGGFTIRSHACLACFGILGSIVQDMDDNYAGFIYPFLIANVPRGFDIILDFVKPIMSPSLARGMVVFTTNQNDEMRKYFNTIIDPNQLGRQYGGTRRIIRNL